MYEIIFIFMLIVGAFFFYALGQSRIRATLKAEYMEKLINIRNLNSAHKPLDAYLTHEINEMMVDVYNLKRKRR